MQTIADALNKMLADKDYLQTLKNNCLEARKIYCWQEEEKKLISFYKNNFE